MPHLISGKAAGGRAPAGAIAATGSVIAGVEAEAANGHEDVAVVHEEGDKFSGTALAVAVELFRSHGTADQASFEKHMGNGTGTIVTAIIERFVSTAPFVGFALEPIGGIHGLLDGGGEAGRSAGGTAIIIQMGLRWQETLRGHKEDKTWNHGRKAEAGP